MKNILHFISYILHPVFILLYGAILYFSSTNSYQNYQTTYIYLLQILMVSVFIPLAVLYFLITVGKVDSIMVYNVAQRKIPLYLQVVLILFLMFNIITINNLPELYFFLLGILASCIISLIFVYYSKKASLHMIGISALTMYCIGLQVHFSIQNYTIVAILIMLNGFVSTSRLYMKAHTNQEIILGFIIGAVPQCVLSILWL